MWDSVMPVETNMLVMAGKKAKRGNKKAGKREMGKEFNGTWSGGNPQELLGPLLGCSGQVPQQETGQS